MRISFGSCCFDGERRLLERAGQPLHLSPKAFALLEVLVNERPRAVSKETLLDRVWPDVIVEEQNVKNTIAEIRTALGPDQSVIRTVQRFGYAFEAGTSLPVTRARLAGPDHVHLLAPGENVIGRDPLCSIALNVSGVSWRHARITIAAGGTTVEDLGSKNGTWLNERRVTEPVVLQDGDTIRFGGASVTFRSADAATTTLL